jgi:hypothetical protein
MSERLWAIYGLRRGPSKTAVMTRARSISPREDHVALTRGSVGPIFPTESMVLNQQNGTRDGAASF